MTDTFPVATDIYEHGIAVNAGDDVPSMHLIATTKIPIYSGFNLSIIDENGNSLNERAANLANVKGPHTAADYYEESDLRYCVLATLYHLNRIIDLYVENTGLFERIHPPGTANRGNMGDPRVFYEIDAFLGAARRVYESIRKVLWKHYYGRGTPGRWKSIRSVVTSPGKVPEGFANKLQEDWKSYGEKLKAFRDCVSHYDPLTDGATTCWMELYAGRWGMTVKLPSNPDAHSRQAFDFATGPEALAYCHSLACQLVTLSEALETEPKIRSFLDNPKLD
jgi:hypothetical protein